MTRSEKNPKVIPVWSQPEATVPSDEVGRSSDCGNRTDIKLKVCLKMLKMLKNDMPVLGLAGCHSEK